MDFGPTGLEAKGGLRRKTRLSRDALVSDDFPRTAIFLQDALEKFQRRSLVPF